MSKFKVNMEFDKQSLKQLDKDLDKLLTSVGTILSSSPNMRAMVDKIQTGMSENTMQFQNSEVWSEHKETAKNYGIIDFDSPLMMTGQMVNDFIFHAGKPKVSQLPYSDEFVVGAFTWAAKERKRPTYRHTLNEIARKEGRPVPYPDTDKFTYIQTTELVKIIMKSPRYPIMDSILNLYNKDVMLHMERLIDKAFSRRR